ncbi:hypothetical protein G5714_004549 [Onychostoma macrolepis]|uniref:Uncharacterized protein n=1 Tax=Onychostoma macrolepis TaxID=369639 RepID=A0A7J6D518_9TELE|nr:hypothetical protein G5714_004549 [Onychostoma macrolepis]
MDSVGVNLIKTAALGRPSQLGMLYDCRKDELIADANVDLNMNDKEKTAVKDFTCTFYGDFQLPSNPTTFEDVMKVFADLPKLLKENQELAVPLRVWLYPLDKLHSRASKLQKDISMNLIQETESVVESLNTAEMKSSDLLEDSPAVNFAAFHDKMQ